MLFLGVLISPWICLRSNRTSFGFTLTLTSLEITECEMCYSPSVASCLVLYLQAQFLTVSEPCPHICYQELITSVQIVHMHQSLQFAD